jgi:diacylglycerol kinase
VAEVAALATGADRYAFAGIGALSLAKAAQAFPHHFLAFIVACCRIVFLDRSFMHPT